MASALNNAFPQHSPSKKTLRLYDEANKEYALKNYKKAYSSVKECIYNDPAFSDAYILQGNIFADIDAYCLSANSYLKAVNIDSTHAKLYLTVGKLFIKCGQYVNAINALRNYNSAFGSSSRYYHYCDSLINVCITAQKYVDNPADVIFVSLDSIINTPNNEYVNTLSSDERLLFFTRQHVVNNIINEDIYVAEKRNVNVDDYDTVYQLSDIVTIEGNEGAVAMSPDGNTIFFAASGRKDGYGSCDIYFSRKIGYNSWSLPVNVGENINTRYWETQPCMSADGRTLYFVSNRPDGYGDSDIWFSMLDDDGHFSKAQNCGNIINTKYKEQSPFIHFDGVTLFFSSDRPGGLGGFDLYEKNMSRISSSAVNLGYPINDYCNQINFVLSPSGKKAYISSVLAVNDSIPNFSIFNIFENYDISCFNMPESLRPLSSICFNGVVRDVNTNHAIINATVDITDKDAGELYSSTKTGYNGAFRQCLREAGKYGITVSAKGYMIFSDVVDINDYTSDTLTVMLYPLENGKDMIIRNVVFAYDSFVLEKESFPELQRVVKMMKDNPDLSFEVRGHTDNSGTDAYNDNLSKERAKAVYYYLISQGISASRLTYNGYGSHFPVMSNDNDKGRSLNRRTEIRVIR